MTGVMCTEEKQGLEIIIVLSGWKRTRPLLLDNFLDQQLLMYERINEIPAWSS